MTISILQFLFLILISILLFGNFKHILKDLIKNIRYTKSFFISKTKKK